MTEKDHEKLKEELSPEEYYVTQNKGTEPAFSGKYDGVKTPGVYNCVVCGEALFSSKTKYDSGSGWPSFWEPINEENVGSEEDPGSYGASEGSMGGIGDFNIGGLAGKKKPKVKKMKRGGLASR